MTSNNNNNSSGSKTQKLRKLVCPHCANTVFHIFRDTNEFGEPYEFASCAGCHNFTDVARLKEKK